MSDLAADLKMAEAAEAEWRRRARKAEAERDRLREEREELVKALRQIADDGGWRTTWHVDEAEPERVPRPTITNHAHEFAAAVLSRLTEPEGCGNL